MFKIHLLIFSYKSASVNVFSISLMDILSFLLLMPETLEWIFDSLPSYLPNFSGCLLIFSLLSCLFSLQLWLPKHNLLPTWIIAIVSFPTLPLTAYCLYRSQKKTGHKLSFVIFPYSQFSSFPAWRGTLEKKPRSLQLCLEDCQLGDSPHLLYHTKKWTKSILPLS